MYASNRIHRGKVKEVKNNLACKVDIETICKDMDCLPLSGVKRVKKGQEVLVLEIYHDAVPELFYLPVQEDKSEFVDMQSDKGSAINIAVGDDSLHQIIEVLCGATMGLISVVKAVLGVDTVGPKGAISPGDVFKELQRLDKVLYAGKTTPTRSDAGVTAATAGQKTGNNIAKLKAALAATNTTNSGTISGAGASSGSLATAVTGWITAINGVLNKPD